MRASQFQARSCVRLGIMSTPPVLPLSLELAFTAFVLAWLPLVITTRGWQNLL